MPCISAGWAIRVGGVVERHRALEGVERSEDEGRGRGVAEGGKSRLPLRRATRAKGVAIVTDG
jgi:hypothetical protein